MRDRSRLSPEAAVFHHDERTLEQRYEDCRAERDELEVKVQVLTELLSDYLFRDEDPWDLLLRFTAVGQKGRTESRRRGAETLRINRATRTGVVYYLLMNGRVKIGFTTSFVARMQAFHAQQQDLLAVESGGYEIESARHAQFAETRVAGSELFGRSKPLDDHIAALRSERPDPWSSACQINGLALDLSGH